MIVYEVKLCEEQLITVLNAITKQQVISDCADNDTLYGQMFGGVLYIRY